jgi:uncharacterized protein YbjT (DUF2867 family)
MLEDKERQEVVIRQSGLEWTIVRPPRYTDEPESGKIGRKDLAGFMLDQLDDTSHVRRAVAVGY